MKFVNGRLDPKYVVPNISPYSVNASAHFIQKKTIIQGMWIHVYIAMYPHSKDILILYVLAKMWIHVYIARYQHLEDIQHIPIFVFDAQAMWIHVYIEMYPHSKDILL